MENKTTPNRYVKVTDKRQKPELNKNIFDKNLKKELKEIFDKKGNDLEYKGLPVTSSTFPFSHCAIQNFLSTKQGMPDVNFVESLKEEFLKFKFNQKSNDLYKFSQTDELMKNNYGASDCWQLSHFCHLLRSTMLPWLRDITGIDLNDDISMFAAQYSNTDCLLCHDDELEFRRIAYIFYLTPDWSKEDGGSLDLFDSIKGQSSNNVESFAPSEIVKSILPVANSFVFFEVSTKSFHQVSEILSKNKTRVSLSGWFHGPPIPRPCSKIEDKPERFHFELATLASELHKWINPMYLSFGTQGSIQEQFIEDSEIQLSNFFQEEKFTEICETLIFLQNNSQVWGKVGPPNKQSFNKFKHSLLYPRNSAADNFLNETNGGNPAKKIKESFDLLQNLINLFMSEEMFLYLSNLTGLTLHPMAADSDDSDSDVTGKSDDITKEDCDVTPAKKSKKDEKKKEEGIDSTCRFELRSWGKRDYSLLSDLNHERGEYALDVNLFFNTHEWDEAFGGYTSYLNSTEELLTVVPTNNCLSVVYRDREANRFVKHINNKAHNQPYFDLSFVYYE